MNSDTYWLISILYGSSILDVVVIIDANDTNFDHENYQNDNNLKYINDKLPRHISTVGPILRIQKLDIFDIINLK